jgi:hypothetical protein
MLGVKKGKGHKLLLNAVSWYCDEELGGSRVDSVGCESCRCSRSPLVSKICGFVPPGYFEEDNKTLILSITVC